MFRLFAAALLIAMAAFTANAQTIDFEDAPATVACEWGGGAIYDQYRGLTWTGFRPLSLTNYNTVCNPSHGSGYQSLPSSLGEYIAIGFGTSEIHSDTPFLLTGFDYGTGWNNGTLLVEGFYENVWTPIKTFDLTLNSNKSYSGNVQVTGLRFIPTWNPGTQIAGADYGGTPYNTFYVDNITVTTVPEPSSMTLILLGIAGFVSARIFRKIING